MVYRDVKGQVKEEFDRIYLLIGAVVIALLIALAAVVVGFVGFILDAQRFKTETYQTLVDKVSEQKVQIEMLTNKMDDAKDFLKNCNPKRTSGC